MKKALIVIFLVTILTVCIVYQKPIVSFLMHQVIYQEHIVISNPNEYKKEKNYNYAQMTDQFKPHNKQDLLNIFYTIFNNGWEKFTFYCDTEYDSCINDIKEITNNNHTLSHINNFVHPFNSYSKIYVNINSFGKIEIEVEKLYQEEEIQVLNQKVDELYQELITEEMKETDKIKIIHDYIINNTVYDSQKATDMLNHTENNIYRSNKAYGPLINGYGICGGYSDAMALFLYKLGIPNYKVSSSNHIWNLVQLSDGKWYHLDLTWDDPVVSTKENVLIHTFFLIDTKQLEEHDTEQHVYAKDVYQEAK